MRYLLGVLLCLMGIGSLLAQEGKKSPKPPLKKRCPLDNCCGCMADDKKHFENENLWKLAQSCWLDLAQYNVREKTEKANGSLLDRAYADARRTGKIVLYVGNTGG